MAQQFEISVPMVGSLAGHFGFIFDAICRLLDRSTNGGNRDGSSANSNEIEASPLELVARG